MVRCGYSDLNRLVNTIHNEMRKEEVR
jgi:hypothetical protein